MLSRLLEGLYHKIFINIVVGISSSVVHVEEYDKKTLQESYSQTFNTTAIDKKLYEYIQSFVVKSPYHYISILDNSPTQGAIPASSKEKILKYIDTNSTSYLVYKNRWAYYSSKMELNYLQKSYSKTGLDFIFSPYLILSRFFKDKIDSSFALYMLIEEQRVSLAVFDNSELQYADYIKLDSINTQDDALDYEHSDADDIELDLDSSIELDELQSIESLDDFGDIEDLDTLDEIDEFDEFDESKEELAEEIDDSGIDNIDGFNEDYHRFTRVQDSINSYYNDARYKSRFLEKIYIADSVGTSRELKRYFEEEIFLAVYTRKVDLAAELCELAKVEIL